MRFYQKINLENLDKIQQEVLDYYKEFPPKLESNREVFLEIPEDRLDVTRSILNKRTRTEIVETTACFVPPGIMTGTHIDGIRRKDDVTPEWSQNWIDRLKDKNITTRNSTDDSFYCNQWTLIIPIEGYEDAVNIWYYNEDVTKDNERVSFNNREQWPYKFFVSCVDKLETLRPQQKVTIDAPTIIKSCVYHNVDNTKNEKTRLVLVVRFVEHKDDMEIEDYFDCEDIKI